MKNRSLVRPTCRVKFKTTVVIPPQNDIDLHANDMNFVAIAENGKLVGFNLLVGGGLSIEHGNKKTYARTASEFGYLPLEHTLAVAEAVVTTQRDWGKPEPIVKMPKPNTRWSAWGLRRLKRKWSVARGSNLNRSVHMSSPDGAIVLAGLRALMITGTRRCLSKMVASLDYPGRPLKPACWGSRRSTKAISALRRTRIDHRRCTGKRESEDREDRQRERFNECRHAAA